jgi:hypothetical protein
MRKARDPDRLEVRTTGNLVFVYWLYDEGTSGTLMISPQCAVDLGAALRAAGKSIIGDAEEFEKEKGKKRGRPRS